MRQPLRFFLLIKVLFDADFGIGYIGVGIDLIGVEVSEATDDAADVGASAYLTDVFAIGYCQEYQNQAIHKPSQYIDLINRPQTSRQYLFR